MQPPRNLVSEIVVKFLPAVVRTHFKDQPFDAAWFADTVADGTGRVVDGAKRACNFVLHHLNAEQRAIPDLPLRKHGLVEIVDYTKEAVHTRMTQFAAIGDRAVVSAIHRVENVTAALRVRVCKDVPMWQPAVVRSIYDGAVRDFEIVFGGFDACVIEEWVSGSDWALGYKPSKRQLLYNALRENLYEPLLHKVRRVFQRKVFLKAEPRLLLEEPKADRVIMGVTDQMGAAVGPALASALKWLKSAWALDGPITLLCGRTVEQLGELLHQADEIATTGEYWVFESDGKGHDLHMNNDHQRGVHSIYRRAGMSARVIAMLIAALPKFGYVCGVKFESDNMMGSGSYDTTLTNSLAMGLALLALVSFLTNLGFRTLLEHGHVRIYVGGDDGATMIRRRLLPDWNALESRIPEFAALIGMEFETALSAGMFMTHVYSGWAAPAMGPRGLTFIHSPRVGRALDRFGSTVQRYLDRTAEDRESVAHLLAQAQLVRVAHMPVLRAIWGTLKRDNGLVRGMEIAIEDRHKPIAENTYETHPDIYFAYHIRYAVSKVECDELEAFIEDINMNVGTFGVFFTHPLFARFTDH
jgi:hypothetical protein